VFFVLLGALMQRDAPEFARARIMSIQQSVIGVSYGVSVVGAGVLGDHLGLQPVLLVSAGIFAVLIVIAVGPLRSWWSVVGAGDPPSLRYQRILASKIQ
jgi:hypothetical protein